MWFSFLNLWNELNIFYVLCFFFFYTEFFISWAIFALDATHAIDGGKKQLSNITNIYTSNAPEVPSEFTTLNSRILHRRLQSYEFGSIKTEHLSYRFHNNICNIALCKQNNKCSPAMCKDTLEIYQSYPFVIKLDLLSLAIYSTDLDNIGAVCVSLSSTW